MELLTVQLNEHAAEKEELNEKLRKTEDNAKRLSTEVQAVKLAGVRKRQDEAAAKQSKKLLFTSSLSTSNSLVDSAKESKNKDTHAKDGQDTQAMQLYRQISYTEYLSDCLRELRKSYHKLILDAQNANGGKG